MNTNNPDNQSTYSVQDSRDVYVSFVGNCLEMNEARLTTALGDLLVAHDLLLAERDELKAENARLRAALKPCILC